MECHACQRSQDGPTEQRGVFPYRWKDVTVIILGCKVHAKEVIDALDRNQGVIAAGRAPDESVRIVLRTTQPSPPLPTE